MSWVKVLSTSLWKFHCYSTLKFVKFIRRAGINLTPFGAEIKEGTVDKFRYFKSTIHTDTADGVLYETTRVVEEVNPRRETFFVAYRRSVYNNVARGLEEREAIRV